MSFRITGLDAKPFRHLYGLSESELAAHGAIRYVAESKPGYPDRVEMRVQQQRTAASRPARDAED